jgi:hypothetical protein
MAGDQNACTVVFAMVLGLNAELNLVLIPHSIPGGKEGGKGRPLQLPPQFCPKRPASPSQYGSDWAS